MRTTTLAFVAGLLVSGLVATYVFANTLGSVPPEIASRAVLAVIHAGLSVLVSALAVICGVWIWDNPRRVRRFMTRVWRTTYAIVDLIGKCILVMIAKAFNATGDCIRRKFTTRHTGHGTS